MTTPAHHGDSGDAPLPSFSELLASYAEDPDDPPPADTVSLSTALAAGDDPHRILSYLTGLGIRVQTLEDLLRINQDETEEELHGWRCREGVAVSIASDGAWVLFID